MKRTRSIRARAADFLAAGCSSGSAPRAALDSQAAGQTVLPRCRLEDSPPTRDSNLLSNAAGRHRSVRKGVPTTSDSRLAKAALANFYDFVCDIPRSAAMSSAELLARIRSVEGEDAYLALRKSTTGAIVLTAHMGSSFEVRHGRVAAVTSHVCMSFIPA